MMLSFDHIERTGLSQQEVLKRAKEHRSYMNDRFGQDICSLQEAIGSVIDAAIEYAQ